MSKAYWFQFVFFVIPGVLFFGSKCLFGFRLLYNFTFGSIYTSVSNIFTLTTFSILGVVAMHSTWLLFMHFHSKKISYFSGFIEKYQFLKHFYLSLLGCLILIVITSKHLFLLFNVLAQQPSISSDILFHLSTKYILGYLYITPFLVGFLITIYIQNRRSLKI